MNPGLELYTKAFWDLISDRSANNRIPWTAVHLWCSAHDIRGQEEEDFHFLVSRMDMAYVDWARKKSKSGTTDKGTNAKPGRLRTKR